MNTTRLSKDASREDKTPLRGMLLYQPRTNEVAVFRGCRSPIINHDVLTRSVFMLLPLARGAVGVSGTSSQSLAFYPLALSAPTGQYLLRIITIIILNSLTNLSNALQVSLHFKVPDAISDLTFFPDIKAWPLLAALMPALLHLTYATPLSPPERLSQPSSSFSPSSLLRRAGPGPVYTSHDTSGPAPSYPGTINCFRSGTWLSQADIAKTWHLACRNEDGAAMDARWSHAHFNFADGESKLWIHICHARRR
ncbi:hypothetical protein G7Y79_00034g069660 [Physcia stellaris]|nr:hypothetical protein G7Y79_00034g069660 [Physcia stellaris]